MYTILVLTLIIGFFSPVQRSEASNICSDEGGRQFILDEKFHTSLKEAVEKNLVNPRNLFTYWIQKKNISDNLDNPWDIFDLCLTEKAHQSEDSCLKKWFRFTTNFDLFIKDLNHFTKCVLPNLEKDDQLRELLASLLENAYLESEKISKNVSEHMIRKSFDGDLVSVLNRSAISENERQSERRNAVRCEIHKNHMKIKNATEFLSGNNADESMVDRARNQELENENDLDCQININKTSISDQQLEDLVKDRISSLCKLANLNTKDRIVCQWPTLRSRLLEYENGQKPSLVHMKWIPTVLKATENVNSAGNLPSLYLAYLLNLERYVVSSYFMLISFIEGDRTGRSSDVASWLAHDIGTRIALDRFSQLRLECQFITNIRSMGYSEISTQVCERLNGAAKLLLSNGHINERISETLARAYTAKGRKRDINDALKQVTGRPTRHQLNTFLMPHLFRSKREQRSMTAVVRQNDHNLRLMAKFIEYNKELSQVPWLNKISKILEIDTTNCLDISRFLIEFGSADEGIPSFVEIAHFLQGNCRYSKDINLWTALGFSFQYENSSLNQIASSVPDREPNLSEVTKLATVALGMSLELLDDRSGSQIEFRTDWTKLSGATNSLIDWISDMKYENGVDPMESIVSGDSNRESQIRSNDPELIDLLDLFPKRNGI